MAAEKLFVKQVRCYWGGGQEKSRVVVHGCELREVCVDLDGGKLIWVVGWIWYRLFCWVQERREFLPLHWHCK